jgi:general secretion pathway protein J
MSGRAFTLMETMVAMGIFALISMLTYATFSRQVDARERAEEITGRYHQIRQAMQRMATEISMAYITAHRDCDEKRTKTIFLGQRATNGMRLDFTSFSHVKMRADANESDQNELSYWVDRHPDDPSLQVLMRREQARIDDEPEEGGVEHILAEGVTELEFEFYDAREDEWEDEWDSSNLDQRRRLPMFVKIQLKALDHRGDEETFVTKTRVFLQREILITGTGFSRCLDD